MGARECSSRHFIPVCDAVDLKAGVHLQELSGSCVIQWGDKGRFDEVSCAILLTDLADWTGIVHNKLNSIASPCDTSSIAEGMGTTGLMQLDAAGRVCVCELHGVVVPGLQCWVRRNNWKQKLRICCATPKVTP